MKQDIRVYYYGNGQLYKYTSLKKTYPSIDEAKRAINERNIRFSSVMKNYKPDQVVLVEYLNKDSSKIIEIIN